MARHRSARHPIDRGARLPGRAGNRAVRLHRLYRHEPARRHRLCDHRPAHPAQTMSGRLSPGIIVILTLLTAFVFAAAGADLLAHNDPLRQSLLMRLRPPGTTTATTSYLL